MLGNGIVYQRHRSLRAIDLGIGPGKVSDHFFVLIKHVNAEFCPSANPNSHSGRRNCRPPGTCPSRDARSARRRLVAARRLSTSPWLSHGRCWPAAFHPGLAGATVPTANGRWSRRHRGSCGECRRRARLLPWPDLSVGKPARATYRARGAYLYIVAEVTIAIVGDCPLEICDLRSSSWLI